MMSLRPYDAQLDYEDAIFAARDAGKTAAERAGEALTTEQVIRATGCQVCRAEPGQSCRHFTASLDSSLPAFAHAERREIAGAMVLERLAA